MNCCSVCEYRKGMSGIKTCTFKDPLQKRAEAMKRIRDREQEESLKISKAYTARRKEEARQRAIKKAKQEKKRRRVDA